MTNLPNDSVYPRSLAIPPIRNPAIRRFFYNISYARLKIRLTETVKAGGCASKLSPAVLDKVLGKLPRQHDPNVLVGFDHADDAGVYKIDPDTALVQTVDFFTPIVDDPYTFGQVAATNALSDVYAMGGRPVTALAHVCFPANGDLEVLEQILAGGLSKMMEAGCTVIGGHSIRDEETKFGYSVTGLIDPSRIFTNGGAQPGDRLLFTKSIGTGVIATAIKQGTAKQSWIDAATRSMTTLNKAAAEVIRDCATHAMWGQPPPSCPAEQSSAALLEQPPANDRLPSTPSPTSPASASSATPAKWPWLRRSRCASTSAEFPCSKAHSSASAPATSPAG